jgi:hypothetical protein
MTRSGCGWQPPGYAAGSKVTPAGVSVTDPDTPNGIWAL